MSRACPTYPAGPQLQTVCDGPSFLLLFNQACGSVTQPHHPHPHHQGTHLEIRAASPSVTPGVAVGVSQSGLVISLIRMALDSKSKCEREGRMRAWESVRGQTGTRPPRLALQRTRME